MKVTMLMLFLLFAGCSSHKAEAQIDSVNLLQTVWNSKSITFALAKIQGLQKVSEDNNYETFSTDKENGIFSLAIHVSKKDKKIVSMKAPLDRGNAVLSSSVISRLQTDDWKTFEHPARGVDYIQLDISMYSEKLGVGFAYDKLDEGKKTRMIYWGGGPQKNSDNLVN